MTLEGPESKEGRPFRDGPPCAFCPRSGLGPLALSGAVDTSRSEHPGHHSRPQQSTLRHWITSFQLLNLNGNVVPEVPAVNRYSLAISNEALAEREAFLRSFESRIALRRRIDFGVTSTSSSSAI